jgi:hypothetical protein
MPQDVWGRDIVRIKRLAENIVRKSVVLCILSKFTRPR